MLKFDLRVKLGRVTSGAKIAVSAFKYFIYIRISYLNGTTKSPCFGLSRTSYVYTDSSAEVKGHSFNG